jgi:hypothetical protein
MKHPQQPETPMMAFYATPNELIAVGAAISRHLAQYERSAHKTREQLEMIALLRSFQGRLAYLANNSLNQPMTLPDPWEAQR